LRVFVKSRGLAEDQARLLTEHAQRGLLTVTVPADDAGEYLGEEREVARSLLREIAVFAPLIAWAFWIGLRPTQFLDVIERPVAQIVERVRPGYYAEHKLVNPLSASSPSAALR
jgi:hypothetical protein